jgi:hypothetical protein
MLTELTITERQDVLNRQSFGCTGAYEQLHGSARFEVDPANSLNARIVDLALAPRTSDGQVECRADIWILRPIEPDRGNGALMYHVVNRGRKGVIATYNLAKGSNRPETEAHFGDGFLLELGYTIAACAWQADVPPSTPDDEHLMTFDVPVATKDGESIMGPVGCEILVDEPCELHSLGSRYHAPYEVAEGTEGTALLTVREKPYGEHRPIDRGSWTFDRMLDGRPAIRYPQGFIPGQIYNLVYTGRDPKVMGLGFAVTRDFVSCLKYETDRFECLKDKVRIDRAHAFGSSQSGRFLRHLLYEGFNQDEQNRKVFDGVIANVAGGAMGSFNHRFAQPSRHASAHFDVTYPTEQFPFTDLPQTDPVTGRTAGLLDRCEAANTIPKIFYTNTSTEYWNRSASLIHTDITGTEDVEVHSAVRIYHFTGTQHGPADLPTMDEELPGNPVNFRLSHRALLVALDDWVTQGLKPPESRHGKISDGTLVDRDRLAIVWPEMKWNLPERHRNPLRLDHGSDWHRGILGVEPPSLGERYPTLLPAVDKDGNEIAGIRLPEVASPLGTFTGWRLRSEAMGAPWAIVGLQGFWLPFPQTSGSSDPRTAIHDRYRDRDDYIRRCRESAQDLIAERYLLERDLDLVQYRAGELYDWAMR